MFRGVYILSNGWTQKIRPQKCGRIFITQTTFSVCTDFVVNSLCFALQAGKYHHQHQQRIGNGRDIQRPEQTVFVVDERREGRENQRADGTGGQQRRGQRWRGVFHLQAAVAHQAREHS